MYTPNSEIIKTIFGSILNAHLASVDDKLQKMSDKLVEATIHLFQKVLRDTRFSPSARKFHYQFNFRELAKVVEGLMRSTVGPYKGNPTKLLRLWVHESKRVFEDRFINTEDIKVFRDYVKDALVKNFGDVDEKDNPLEEPLIFTSFVNDQQYVNSDMAALKHSLAEKLQEYNEQKAQMNLVLFQ
jgi:dynein heavy chain